MAKEHFIAMSGSYGCIPDNIATFERKADAIYHIISTFELALYGRKADNLREVGYADLGEDYGADYAEIKRCNCSNSKIHEEERLGDCWNQ